MLWCIVSCIIVALVPRYVSVSKKMYRCSPSENAHSFYLAHSFFTYSIPYHSYEEQGKFRRQIKAQKLWFAILEAQTETGTPYMLYKDACNRKSNQQVSWKGILSLLPLLLPLSPITVFECECSGRLGQVDFAAGQVTFHWHLPDKQEPRQVVCQLNKKVTKTCSRRVKFQSCLSEVQARI